MFLKMKQKRTEGEEGSQRAHVLNPLVLFRSSEHGIVELEMLNSSNPNPLSSDIETEAQRS